MRLIRENDGVSLTADELEEAVRKLQDEQLTTVERTNARVATLYASGLLRDVLVLGPVVMERPYGGSRAQETHEVIQAGISSSLGLVAIYWYSDEYLVANFDPPAALVDMAKHNMMAVAGAEPIVRALVGRLAESLFGELLKLVTVHVDAPDEVVLPIQR